MFKFSDLFNMMWRKKFKKLIFIALIAEAAEQEEMEELIKHYRRKPRSIWT